MVTRDDFNAVRRQTYSPQDVMAIERFIDENGDSYISIQDLLADYYDMVENVPPHRGLIKVGADNTYCTEDCNQVLIFIADWDTYHSLYQSDMHAWHQVFKTRDGHMAYVLWTGPEAAMIIVNSKP